MSVTGSSYNINATKRLSNLEIEHGLEGNQSWHHAFRHSAYVFVGGLHEGLSEGDLVIVFSEWGEIVDVNLVRHKDTGKSKGFGFLCYEDQRSTVLAVDNMNGTNLLGRTLRVDHVDKYKAPKDFDQEDLDEDGDPKLLEYKATGAEGKGMHAYNVLGSQKRIHDVESKKKVAVSAGSVDMDEEWAKSFEDSLKTKTSEKDEKRAVVALKRQLKEEKKKHKKEKKTAKKEKKAAKKEKKAAKKAAKAAEKSAMKKREIRKDDKEECRSQRRRKVERIKNEPPTSEERSSSSGSSSSDDS